jgi:hypothetical protein
MWRWDEVVACLEGVFIDEKKEKSSAQKHHITEYLHRVPYDNPAPQFRLGSHME